MKNVWLILLSGVLCLTGCGGISLTEKEQGMIAEYAASVLLQYSTTYQGKYQTQIQEEETIPAITESLEETAKRPDEHVTEQNLPGNIEETLPKAAQEPLEAAMGLDGFEVTYSGYEAVSAYPDAEEIFIMKASSGQMLLILKFQIMNTGSEEKLCDVLSNQLGFRLQVNGEKSLNMQLTMLLNDLYAYKDNILPGETRETVLVFQIPESEAAVIHTLDLSIQYHGITRLYPLGSSE